MCSHIYATAFSQVAWLFGLPKMLMKTRSVGQALSCLSYRSKDFDGKPPTFSRQLRLAEKARSASPYSIVERKPKMEEIETTDNLDDAQVALRGASQVLQALAVTPDCIETGECLTLVSDAIESAIRCIETAKDTLD